jgi:hypothetical protein
MYAHLKKKRQANDNDEKFQMVYIADLEGILEENLQGIMYIRFELEKMGVDIFDNEELQFDGAGIMVNIEHAEVDSDDSKKKMKKKKKKKKVYRMVES